MTGLSLKEITLAGFIGALYAVLGLTFYPISFGVYQVRVAEALTVLPYRTRAAIPGLFVGCMLVNVFGGLGWQDVIFGSLITLAAALATRAIRQFSKLRLASWLSLVPLVLLWVGSVYLLRVSTSIDSDLLLPVISAILLITALKLKTSRHNASWFRAILTIISLILLVLFGYMRWQLSHASLYIIGSVALLGAWLVTWMLVRLWLAGENPNILLAPLPPVLFNAFGVSLYLAPIMGVNYWFAVQMVGVGQLIACYILGLPLLRLIETRKGFVFDL